MIKAIREKKPVNNGKKLEKPSTSKLSSISNTPPIMEQQSFIKPIKVAAPKNEEELNKDLNYKLEQKMEALLKEAKQEELKAQKRRAQEEKQRNEALKKRREMEALEKQRELEAVEQQRKMEALEKQKEIEMLERQRAQDALDKQKELEILQREKEELKRQKEQEVLEKKKAQKALEMEKEKEQLVIPLIDLKSQGEKAPELQEVKAPEVIKEVEVVKEIVVVKEPEKVTPEANKKFLKSHGDIKRVAGVYNKRLADKSTPTRVVKAAFFNHILDNWEQLQSNGIVRVNAKEAPAWYDNPTDDIFSIEYEA